VSRYGHLLRAAARKTPRQLAGVVHRKARNRVLPRLPLDFDSRYRRHVPDAVDCSFATHCRDTAILRDALADEGRERYRRLARDAADGEVTLLNRTRRVHDPGAVTPDDDRLADLPRLWYLKLVAMEPARWAVLGFADPEACPAVVPTLSSWLQSLPHREPIAARTGYLRGFWTPYAVSLRILTLCRYAAWNDGLPEGVVPFLYKNLLFLSANVETDVDGNHLFENGAALVAGGLAVEPGGGQFVEQGLAMLERASAEQFLDDGYHYERSPMYHLAVTTRLLTTLSLLSASDHSVPGWLHTRTEAACAFVSYLRPPDGRIPLLNDAVFDEAHGLDTVSRYARAVGVDPEPLDAPGDSGLYWLRGGDLSLLFDAGDSGPSSQLGHTHNDPCTVLVWSGDHRIVTDTGTFDYQPGPRRQTARGVRSHNTIQVDDEEPTSVGGRFRMGASVTTTITRHGTDAVDAVTAEYRAGTVDTYTHTRTCYAGPGWLFVWDVADPTTEYVSRLHTHPDVSVSGGGDAAAGDGHAMQLEDGGGTALAVHPVDTTETTVRTGPYFPRFGEERKRDVLELHSRTATSGYALTPPETRVSFEQSEGQPTALTVDGERYDFPEGQA